MPVTGQCPGCRWPLKTGNETDNLLCHPEDSGQKVLQLLAMCFRYVQSSGIG
jgi:hypothetical protein